MPNILSFLTETATLYRRAGVTPYGEPMRDAGREVLCRAQVRRSAACNRDGEEFLCAGEVWLAPDEAISPGDELLYDGDYLQVRALERITDVAGTTVGLRALIG